MSYSFKVRPVNVPPKLVGVPLPVEVSAPDRSSRWTIVNLLEGTPSLVEVPEKGTYDLRAELPSGDHLRASVEVHSDQSAPTIDLQFPTARQLRPEGPAERGLQATTKRVPERSMFASRRSLESLDLAGVTRSLIEPAPGVEGREHLFQGWATSPQEREESIALRTRVESPWIAMPFSQPMAPGPHPGWTGTGRERRPMIFEARYERTRSGSGLAAVVVPPVAESTSFTLVADPDPHPDLSAPQLLAYVDSPSSNLDALFSYVRGGSFESARHLMEVVREQAEQLLYTKFEDPIGATIGAYALYRLGETERLRWVANLASQFPHLPDGAIIYGSFMIAQGESKEARQFFITALDRGIPMYSEGVRLLRDGLTFLRGLNPDDGQVRAYASRAYRLAGLANMDSELTCLNLGKALRMTGEAHG